MAGKKSVLCAVYLQPESGCWPCWRQTAADLQHRQVEMRICSSTSSLFPL